MLNVRKTSKGDGGMNETITIDEIIVACRTGGYVGGEVFVNQMGQEIMFDGYSITGLSEINPNDQWQYIEKEVAV